MARQSISFTPPNDEWLKAQVDSEEYSSKSDVVNDLIRKAREKNREIEYIRATLIEGEKPAADLGWVEKTAEEMLAGFKKKARRNGKF